MTTEENEITNLINAKVWMWSGDKETFNQDKLCIGSSVSEKMRDYSIYNDYQTMRADYQKAHGNTDVSVPDAYWKFMKHVHVGDIVVVFKSKRSEGRILHDLYGWGIITSELINDISSNNPLQREVKWKQVLESPITSDINHNTLFFHRTSVKEATQFKSILGISSSDIENDARKSMKTTPTTRYNKYIKLLKESKNLILTGAPGTGKTYITTALAVLMCAPDKYTENHAELKKIYKELQREGKIGFTTFHQSMDYEDFVEGLKPEILKSSETQKPSEISTEGGDMRFVVKKGLLRRMCDNAVAHPDENFLLIIDEINRANISKVLGELITLLESTKRLGEDDEFTVTLPYSGDTFGVPGNLYIIGTMNTADRSLGYIDYAIRRRFAFCPLIADAMAILDYYNGTESELYLKERELMKNVRIIITSHHSQDFEVDDIMVGHSYFMAKDEDTYDFNLRYKIKPLLQEYLRDGLLVEKGTEVSDAVKNLE